VRPPPSFQAEYQILYPDGVRWAIRRAQRKKKSRKARQPEIVKAKPTTSTKTKVAKSTSKSKKRPAKSTNKPQKKQKKNTAKGSNQDSSGKKKPKKKTPAKKSKKQAQQQEWVLPTIKRTGSVSLQRGGEHVLEAAVGNIEMGLGWNSPFDIAAGVLIFDDKYQHVETVDWRALKSTMFEISHSGDVLNGAAHAKVDGDDEKVRVNLHTLPPNIVTLMFLCCHLDERKDVEGCEGRRDSVGGFRHLHREMSFRIESQKLRPDSGGSVMQSV